MEASYKKQKSKLWIYDYWSVLKNRKVVHEAIIPANIQNYPLHDSCENLFINEV